MAKSAAQAMDCSRRPSFFKVFFPELSAEYMTIPPAFSKNMETESNNSIVSLQGPSGRVWRVHLLRDSRGLSFHKGWKEFLADHSIVVGDFLLFRYDRTAHFTVSVFDYTTCEKKSAFSATPKERQDLVIIDTDVRGTDPPNVTSEACERGERKRKAENVVVKMERERESEDDCIAIKRGRRTALAIKEPGSTSHSLHAARKSPKLGIIGKTLLPSSSDGAVQGVKRGSGPKFIFQRKQKKKSHSCIAKSKTQVKQVSEIDPWSTILLRSICKNPQELNDLTSIKMKRLVAMVEELRLESLLSQRQPVSEPETCKALEMANSFKSRNPFIVKVMREAYISKSYCLHFPRGFTTEHLPKNNEDMTLWDPEGKPWLVKYASYNNCGRFLSGWCKFCHAHNLELHDVCVFEVIEKNQMKVHICRRDSQHCSV